MIPLQIHTTDIESIIILLLLTILFVSGLKRQHVTHKFDYSIDIRMSNMLKGIACIFILLGHFMSYYYDHNPETLISKVIYASTANIALVLFMFISGYGLSCKFRLSTNECALISDKVIHKSLFDRLKKIISPFLIVVIVTHLLYLVLPTLEADYIARYRLPNLGGGVVDFFSDKDLPRLRYRDWYVECICLFYAIFHLSLFLSQKIIAKLGSLHNIQSYVLWGLLLIYLIGAMHILGESMAHYYRYPWAFFLGHVFTRLSDSATKHKTILLFLAFVLLLPVVIDSKLYIIITCISITLLLFVSLVNCKYYYDGKTLLELSSLSYFFYLTHERIGYLLMAYTRTMSPILWILITIVVSYIISKVFVIIFNKSTYK